ncbi:hypothetical protein Btru_046307 [Bulinus truncatus]|nr:hypothetical protein Btru_046307 [Bulinus truncatus]
MTTVGFDHETPWRVDALSYPSYNYPYPAFKRAQLDQCYRLNFSTRPPMFRRLDADRIRSYTECERREATAMPGATKRDLDALAWMTRLVNDEPDFLTPNLNSKEYARWRFETTPLFTTETRSGWSHFLNRCPERFNVSLPLEAPGKDSTVNPYFDGGYAIRYLRSDLTRGLGMERWPERPLGYIQGPADNSPFRAIKVNNALADFKVKGYKNMAAHGIDRIPDSLGFLVMTEDGAVISSGGQLENDEVTANKITKLVHTAFKIPVTSEKKDTLRRISVILGDVILMATVSQHKIFVLKRHYVPQEPVQA